MEINNPSDVYIRFLMIGSNSIQKAEIYTGNGPISIAGSAKWSKLKPTKSRLKN